MSKTVNEKCKQKKLTLQDAKKTAQQDNKFLLFNQNKSPQKLNVGKSEVPEDESDSGDSIPVRSENSSD